MDEALSIFPKVLLKFIAFACIFIIVSFLVILNVTYTKWLETRNKIDTQAMAAFKTAARTCQYSVEGATDPITGGGDIKTENPDFYKFYCNNDGTKSPEYIKYLNALGDDQRNLLTDNFDYGMIPMDIALPYVQLESTSMSATNLDTVQIKHMKEDVIETVSFDSFLTAKVDQYLTMSIANTDSTGDDWICILDEDDTDTSFDGVGIPKIDVEMDSSDEDFDDFDGEIFCCCGNKDAIIKTMGPIILDNKNDIEANLVNAKDELYYYNLRIKIKYQVGITLPLASNIIGVQDVEETYKLKYSMLN